MEQRKIWDHFQNSEDMDDVFASALPRYEFLARQIKSDMNVLNIGVGRGGLESVLVNKDVVVNCLDPSEETIDRLRKQYNLGVRAQVGYSQNMPFQDGEFDVVIMSEVLEHLTNDVLLSTFGEVRRVLKPNGFFMGTVPANEILFNNNVMCPHCGESFHRWGHVQSFSALRLNEVLSNSNFTVQRVESRAFPPWQRGGLKNFVKNAIRYLLGRFGAPISSPHFFFRARR